MRLPSLFYGVSTKLRLSQFFAQIQFFACPDKEDESK